MYAKVEKKPKLKIGKKVKKLRESLGLSASELGNKIGSTPTTIYFIESDRSLPNLTRAKNLANALGVTLDELCSEVKPKEEIAAKKNKKKVPLFSKKTEQEADSIKDKKPSKLKRRSFKR